MAVMNVSNKWHRKLSVFAKRAIENNFDVLAETRIKIKTKIT